MLQIRAQAPFPVSSQQACDFCGCLCIHNVQMLAAVEHSQGSECQECWELSDSLGPILRGLNVDDILKALQKMRDPIKPQEYPHSSSSKNCPCLFWDRAC